MDSLNPPKKKHPIHYFLSVPMVHLSMMGLSTQFIISVSSRGPIMSTSTCPSLTMSTCPCPYVHVLSCPYVYVSMSICPCVHVHMSACPCPIMSICPHVHVHMSMCPCPCPIMSTCPCPYVHMSYHAHMSIMSICPRPHLSSICPMSNISCVKKTKLSPLGRHRWVYAADMLSRDKSGGGALSCMALDGTCFYRWILLLTSF